MHDLHKIEKRFFFSNFIEIITKSRGTRLFRTVRTYYLFNLLSYFDSKEISQNLSRIRDPITQNSLCQCISTSAPTSPPAPIYPAHPPLSYLQQTPARVKFPASFARVSQVSIYSARKVKSARAASAARRPRL